MISVRIQGKPFNITVIQVYVPTRNTEEAEVERFYEDLQELLELTAKNRCPFHYRGRSELHWVWCSRRGPYLELRQEPHGSSPFLNRICVHAELGQESQASSCVEEFNSDDHYIYYCGQESLRRNGVAIMINKRV